MSHEESELEEIEEDNPEPKPKKAKARFFCEFVCATSVLAPFGVIAKKAGTIHLEITKDGLTSRQMDSSRIQMFEWIVPKEACEQWEVAKFKKGEESFRINYDEDEVARLFKDLLPKRNSFAKVRIDSDTLEVTYEHQEMEGYTTRHTIKTHASWEKVPTLPVLDFKYRTWMFDKEMRALERTLKAAKASVSRWLTTESELIVESKSEAGDTELRFPLRQLDGSELQYLSDPKLTGGIYAVELLKDVFEVGRSVQGTLLMVEWGVGMPMRLTFTTNWKGGAPIIHCWQAPRVEDEDW